MSESKNELSSINDRYRNGGDICEYQKRRRYDLIDYHNRMGIRPVELRNELIAMGFYDEEDKDMLMIVEKERK